MSPLVTLKGVPLGPWDPTTTAACEPLPSASTFSPSFQCVPPGTALPVAMTVHVQLGTVEVLFLSAGSATCDGFLAELHARLGPGDVWQDGDTRATFRRDGAGPCSLYVSSTRVRRAGEAPPLGFDTQPPFGFGPASVLGRPPLVSCEGGPGRWVCPAEVGGSRSR